MFAYYISLRRPLFRATSFGDGGLALVRAFSAKKEDKRVERGELEFRQVNSNRRVQNKDTKLTSKKGSGFTKKATIVLQCISASHCPPTLKG